MLFRVKKFKITFFDCNEIKGGSDNFSTSSRVDFVKPNKPKPEFINYLCKHGGHVEAWIQERTLRSQKMWSLLPYSDELMPPCYS